tara:strand:+ start:4331 stop:4570 length:240 start_codon:yes stop_codon:yes gene_type:complete
MLQKGQEENRKNVNITLFPFIDDISKVEPSIVGSEIFGAKSPFFSLGIVYGRAIGVKTTPLRQLILKAVQNHLMIRYDM